MADFQFYVTDDRYSVRTFLFVQANNIAAARVLAKEMLARKHHHDVEVWAGDTRLFHLSEGAAGVQAAAAIRGR